MAEESRSLEYTPTWVVAGVCSVIVLISLLVERGLHQLGKRLKHGKQTALFEALQKLKEELMLLGFISLLLTVFQGVMSRICIPTHFASKMLPCKMETVSSNGSEIHKHEQYSYQGIKNGRRLLSAEASSDHCAHKGEVPMISIEALHQLHIFIFVLAVVHMVFCATTLVLGGIKIRQWKQWELDSKHPHHAQRFHHEIFKQRTVGYWRKSAIISWIISFVKQFYGSVTMSDYVALRNGFIKAHCPNNPKLDFHEYMMRTVELDFKRVVGISWYQWLFVVAFLLLNMKGWHTYFWLSFLPLILLLLLGAKLEHIITRLAQEVAAEDHHEVKPSDELFWFGSPSIVLYLIHFILFQNSFEIGFFFWIWTIYGFDSCIMEKLGYIIPRLIMGVIVQVLCSYSTLPLYTLVTQMGSKYKPTIFGEETRSSLQDWAHEKKMDKMVKDSFQNLQLVEQTTVTIEGTTTSITEFASPTQIHSPSA